MSHKATKHTGLKGLGANLNNTEHCTNAPVAFEFLLLQKTTTLTHRRSLHGPGKCEGGQSVRQVKKKKKTALIHLEGHCFTGFRSTGQRVGLDEMSVRGKYRGMPVKFLHVSRYTPVAFFFFFFSPHCESLQYL